MTADHNVVATLLVYNGAETLEQVLSGLAEQQGFRRVIAIDNGSLDDSVAILERWADRLPLTLVTAGVNLGVGLGHWMASCVARSLSPCATHLWSLEHDSVALSGCLEAQLSAARERTIVIPRLERDEQEAAAGFGVLGGSSVIPVTRFTFNGTLWPLDVFSALGPPRFDLFVGNEDWDLSRRAAAAGVPVVQANDAVMVHRTKGAARNRERPGPVRAYYSARGRLLLARGETRRVPIAARVLGRAIEALVQGDRPRASALWHATVDGLVGRGGEMAPELAARLRSSRTTSWARPR